MHDKDIQDIDEDTALVFINRMLDVMSKRCDIVFKATWICESLSIKVGNNENDAVISYKHANGWASKRWFTSAIELLDVLLLPYAAIISKNIAISLSTTFGTSINEVKVNLDLIEDGNKRQAEK